MNDGLVPGSSDVVPALLDPGVSYLSREAVEKFGLEKLKAINGGGRVKVCPCGLCDGDGEYNDLSCPACGGSGESGT